MSEEGGRSLTETTVDEYGYSTDDYGVIHNSPETYRTISAHVRVTPVILAWTDDQMTMLAVQFSMPQPFGPVPGGFRRGHLYVSVEGFGSYSFDPHNTPLHSSYVAEKLGRGQVNPTWEAMAELVNGVCQALTESPDA